MSEGEDYVINAYWEETRAPGSQGAIYRNFKIIESGEGRRERRADAVVVESKSADEGHVHDLPDLDSLFTTSDGYGTPNSTCIIPRKAGR